MVRTWKASSKENSLLCFFYREWKYVNQQDDSSHSVASQLQRWCAFLEQWEKAISFGSEIIVTGDMNLNFLNWCDDQVSTTQEPSGLDHLYSNFPERLSAIQTRFRGSSDHKLICVTRLIRAPISKPRIIRKRCYKNFDSIKYIYAVKSVS